MKERQPIKESKCSQSNDDVLFLRLALIAFVLNGALIAYLYKDTRDLEDKCITEQVINKQGYPGQNFNFETEGLQECDIFMPSKYLPGNRRLRGKDVISSSFRMGW